jgi:hypothetical protein
VTGRGEETRGEEKWVRQVMTDSTLPPPRTFTGSASEIARKMARRDLSPKGLGSGIRMIQYFINRGGKNLSATRRTELERAKSHFAAARGEAEGSGEEALTYTGVPVAPHELERAPESYECLEVNYVTKSDPKRPHDHDQDVP